MPDMTDRTNRDPGEPSPRDYAFRVYPLDDADEVRLGDLWRAIWRGRRLILSIAAGTAVLAGVAAMLMTPVYRSQVLMAPAAEDATGRGLSALAGQFADVAALAGINLGGGSSTAESIATLRSRSFTDGFIREHGLMPVLFPEEWDQAGQTSQVPSGEAPTMEDAYRLFDSIRNVDEDLQTGLVTVTVDWSDPKLAAKWANGLVQDVNELLRTRAIRDSRRNLEFLNKELQTVDQIEVRTAIYGLIEAEMKNAMFANAKSEYAFKVIDPAVIAEKKDRPNRLLIVLIGLCAGILLGILAAVVRNAISDRS